MKTYDLNNREVIKELLTHHRILTFRIRNSRIKAKQPAIMEVYCLLKDKNIIFLPNGPLGDIRGLFSFMVHKNDLNSIQTRFNHLGYIDNIYILDFNDPNMVNTTDLHSINPLCWKKNKFSLHHFFEPDQSIIQSSQVHNRTFFIYDKTDSIKKIIGYRGNGSETGSRALPVEDARHMLNLCSLSQNQTILDPFAGSGGIIYEAKNYHTNLYVHSNDIDRTISPGLENVSDYHLISDIKQLSFPSNTYDAVVTEVPFSPSCNNDIISGFEHIFSAIKFTGKLVIMCSESQYPLIHKGIQKTGYTLYFYSQINRKGTPVYISAYSKTPFPEERIFFDSIKKIY